MIIRHRKEIYAGRERILILPAAFFAGRKFQSQQSEKNHITEIEILAKIKSHALYNVNSCKRKVFFPGEEN